MRLQYASPLAAFTLPAVAALVLWLTGCSLTATEPSSPEVGSAIQGVVHGGQQPVVGTHVYLYAANTTGYGNASVSLLTSAVPAVCGISNNSPCVDGSGNYYVVTSASGSFTITGDYTCTANTQVYLYAVGGDPGAGTNSAVGLLAVLGNCPVSGIFLATIPIVQVNEVTTIAAAYSFAGFAVDALHVSSSGTALAQIGIANAFANAANLASISTGAALSTIPAGNATVPQTTINTLANTLAACVNSAGPTSTSCSQLFFYAESAGSTGTKPTDTATAAINIAHYPGSNVSALYNIASPAYPFAPALPSSPLPNDFSLALVFTGGSLDDPTFVAIDGSGNAWITNYKKPVVTEISSAGVFLSGANGYSGGDPFHYFSAIAIDNSGNAWVTNSLDNALVEFSSSGVASASSPITTGGLNNPDGIAIDGGGQLWLPNAGNNSLSAFSASGVPIAGAPFTGGGLNIPFNISLDNTGDVWVGNCGSSTGGVSKFSSAGVSLVGTTGYTTSFHCAQAIATDSVGNAWVADNGSGVIEISPSGAYLATGYEGGGIGAAPYAIAIDGASSAWVLSGDNGIAGISSSGTYLSGTSGYKGGGVSGFESIAIDGSGDAWLPNDQSNFLVELIGIAAPVVTPLSVGAANHTIGTRP